MMQDLTKAFTTYASPDTDAQRKQYQRMLDLTRSAANACTGLYDEQLKDPEKKKLFVDLHIAELKALIYSKHRRDLEGRFDCFEKAINQRRDDQCRNKQCREDLLKTETALLKAIHKLETESWLDKLRGIDLLLIGITIALLLGLWLESIKLINWLPESIANFLPDVVKDQGWLIAVSAWVFALLLARVFALLLVRVFAHLLVQVFAHLLARITWRRRDKTKDDNLDSGKQANRTSFDGDSSA